MKTITANPNQLSSSNNLDDPLLDDVLRLRSTTTTASPAASSTPPTSLGYRPLSDDESRHIQEIKALTADFISKLHAIGRTDPASDRMSSRNLSLAMTHIEDASMRAVRHITS